ncbi:MAG: IS110 family transposase [Rhodanobacter sp.]
MSSLTVFVGLDYHQAFVQVCVMDAQGIVLSNRRCENSARRIVEAVKPYGARVAAAIEACCGAAALADELLAAGWQVSLAHAAYVNKLKQSPDKTDWSDARLLADLLRVGYLPRVWLPPAELRQLRHVVRYRQQLAEARRNAKLRVTALLRTHRIESAVRRWTKAWIGAVRSCKALGTEGNWVVGKLLDEVERVQQQLDVVEARLAALTADDPFVQKLLSYVGIGLVTAVMLRAELGDLRRFRSGKQLARFAGLSPRNASSGLKQADAGLIRAGNPQLRAVLIEAAHRLTRCDPRWATLGSQLRSRGKPGSLVAAAVANRWVRWMYHQLQDVQAS